MHPVLFELFGEPVSAYFGLLGVGFAMAIWIAMRACKRAEIFARDNAYSGRFFVKPAARPGDPGEVMVSSRSNERGDNEGIVDASVEGEPLDIAFNIRYLIDVLNVINDERVVVESNGSANPGVIRPENRDDFIHVIMPMSVTR